MTNKQRVLKNSSIKILIKTIFIIFCVEFITHKVFSILPEMQGPLRAAADSATLSLLLLFPLWFWVFQPLRTVFFNIESELDIYNSALDKHVIISKTDLTGKITYANKKFEQISGYTEQELIGKDHRLLSSGQHPKEFFSKMWQQLKAGKVWRGQIKNKAKDGSYYWVDTIISPILDSNGILKEFISIRSDITKDRVTLHETNLQKVFYETILNTMEQGFTIKNKLGKIEHFNKTALRLLELMPDEDFNYASAGLFIKEDETPFSDEESPSMQALKTGYPQQNILGIKKKDGSLTWLQVYSVPFDAEPNCLPDTVLTTFLDITQQIIKKKILADSEQALQLERLKSIQALKLSSLGEISAHIVHEINNPLTIISCIVELLPKVISDPVKLTSRTEELNKAVKRIVKIVHGLQKYSRSSSDDNRTDHPLFELAEVAVSLCALKSKRHDTTITTENKHEGSVFCDEVEIEQVLINLISNAIDAVKNLEHRWIKIQVFEESPDMILRVCNPGCIPEDICEKLFVSFYTTKPVGEGTGLGLSISKDIITKHNGTLKLLKNRPDTCFEIRLPKFVNTKADSNES